ncbi:MAG: hypothetical protein ISP90_14405 [Nevskia sp.]|nr:hypothetical protein [Nevskia sp.]
MATDVRHCGVLFIDVAGSTALRAQIGDAGAAERLRRLLDVLTELVRAHHGQVLKSDGDDLLCLFSRGTEAAADVAEAAISAQRAARGAGLGLYAGLHVGPVTLIEVLGRTDVDGLAVNYAARLHKLTPGVPGSIFLAQDAVNALPAYLRDHTRLFGNRHLKGIGDARVYTLDWDDRLTVAATQMAGRLTAIHSALLLKHAGGTLLLRAGDPPLLAGRSKSQCAIVFEDPDLLVSSRHVQILHQHGGWYAKDVSRNGTWLLNGATGDAVRLLNNETLMPRSGSLHIGREPKQDPDRRFRLEFELTGA